MPSNAIITPCNGCAAIIGCQDITDPLYSLEDAFLGIRKNCPPGFPDCDKNSNTITLKCCGQTLSAVIPAGATQLVRNAITNSLNAQCAALIATCGGGKNLICSTPQSCMVTCPDGTPFSYTVPAGFACADTQSAANAIAKAAACSLANSNKQCGPYFLTLTVNPQSFNLGSSTLITVTLHGKSPTDPLINNQAITFSGPFPNYPTSIGGPTNAPDVTGGLLTNSSGIATFSTQRIGFLGPLSPYAGYGLCNFQAFAPAAPTSPASNIVPLTLVVPNTSPIHLDATTLAYIIGKWTGNGGSMTTYNGVLYPSYQGIPGPPATEGWIEHAFFVSGNQEGFIFTNAGDIIMNYRLHPTLNFQLQYTKFGTSITNPTGVWTLTADPYGDAPATATLT